MAVNCAVMRSEGAAFSSVTTQAAQNAQRGTIRQAPNAMMSIRSSPRPWRLTSQVEQLKKGSSCSSLSTRQQRRRQRPSIGVRAHTTTEAAEVDRTTCPKVKDQIDLSDFEKIDIRVGLVTDAKSVPDKEMTEKRGKPTMSRKLLQLKVDIGTETRTVVSECKYVMDVEDAVGKKVLFVANVPPAEVEGIRSHGLILQGLNYDTTPMPRSFKVILPGLGKLPPGSPIIGASIPK